MSLLCHYFKCFVLGISNDEVIYVLVNHVYHCMSGGLLAMKANQKPLLWMVNNSCQVPHVHYIHISSSLVENNTISGVINY